MKDNDDDTYPTGSQKDSGMLLYKENVPNPDPFAELKVLDDNHLKLRVQSLFEERNANLKRLIEDVFSVVTEISDIIQQTTTIQDELTLDAYNRELNIDFLQNECAIRSSVSSMQHQHLSLKSFSKNRLCNE
ncbi:hypothetical protein DFQ29_001516 [Apophysomyces sp. BC1021]|nr:hypothetical protein DFQ29_001516 [Apophysomyces sp. BC1021]